MIKLGFHSGADFPSVRLRPQLIDYILMGVAFALNIFMWIFAFNLQGQGLLVVENYLLLMSVITIMVVILSVLLCFTPSSYFRFPYKLTSRNLYIQYSIALRFTRVICIWVALLSFLLVLHGESKLIQIVFITLLGLSLIVYYAIAYFYR